MTIVIYGKYGWAVENVMAMENIWDEYGFTMRYLFDDYIIIIWSDYEMTLGKL